MKWLIALLIALLFTAATDSADRDPFIEANRVALDPSTPARRDVGPLRYLGGWQLTSSRKDFGGISSIHVTGDRILALSDAGVAFRFRLDDSGKPIPTTFIPLLAGPGISNDKDNRDTESMVVDSVTGRIWVGFEGWNAIWRYREDFAVGEAHVAPLAMNLWPKNGGPETMARMADGTFLIFAEEDAEDDGMTDLIRFTADPTDPATPAPASFRYRAPEGYAVTDAAPLPDGRLLVLHRRFTYLTGVSAKLSIVDVQAIRAGEIIEGREIASFTTPMTVDNFEALSVERAGDGQVIVWIASDNNFSWLQRTLLLKFRLDLQNLPAWRHDQGAGEADASRSGDSRTIRAN